MYAGSLSKQVVAALAAELVLSGRLDPDTRIRLLLPDLPAWAGAIRVRHLVHHTSGLPSTDRVMTAAGVAGAAQLDNALVLNGLHGLADPDRPAGTAFVYSNVGYVVLAEVVGVVAGEAIGGFAHRMLFSPLGLTGSHLGGAADVVLPGLPAPPRTVGDGGWWTTARDLLAWLDCLNAGRLGQRADPPDPDARGSGRRDAAGVRVGDDRQARSRRNFLHPRGPVAGLDSEDGAQPGGRDSCGAADDERRRHVGQRGRSRDARGPHQVPLTTDESGWTFGVTRLSRRPGPPAGGRRDRCAGRTPRACASPPTARTPAYRAGRRFRQVRARG